MPKTSNKSVKSRRSSVSDTQVALQAHTLINSELVGSTPELIIMTQWAGMKLERGIWRERNLVFGSNMLASTFTWFLLAGYIVFPGTFATVRESPTLNKIGEAGKVVVRVANLPLLGVAGFFCGAATVGIIFLWRKNHHNWIWLSDRLFLPCLLNSVVGLITTLINIYTAQGGRWSATSITTASVTGSCALITSVLYISYALKVYAAFLEHTQVNKTE